MPITFATVSHVVDIKTDMHCTHSLFAAIKFCFLCLFPLADGVRIGCHEGFSFVIQSTYIWQLHACMHV